MKYFILLCLIVSTGKLSAQSSCCIKATDEFAGLGNNKDFRMAHAEPLPMSWHATSGKDISYALADGSTAHAFEIKAPKETPYYLFVIHEWWGLNDYVKMEAEKLANDLGVNVLALDLYDNKSTSNRDEAATLMRSVKNERAVSIIEGAYAYAGIDAKVFTIGWCFGGGWSLQTALIGGNRVKGCVMYYGMPEKDVEKLKTLSCDVIGFFAKKDQGITPQVVSNFEENMKAAGKKVTVYEYDAEHAFANPSNPAFDKAASQDSYAKTLAFIKARMN